MENQPQPIPAPQQQTQPVKPVPTKTTKDPSPYASGWIRLLAMVLDVIIIGVIA